MEGIGCSRETLGSNTLKGFERKYSIKNLFNHNTILNSFNRINFESLNTFTKIIEKDMLPETNADLYFHISTEEEFESYYKIIISTNLYQKFKINFIFNKEINIFDFIKENELFPCSLYMSMDYAYKYLNNDIENFKKWNNSNPIYINVLITKENYKNIFEDIIYNFLEKGIRFIKIDIDYISFEDIKLSEIHLLKFWWNQLRIFDKVSIKESRNMIKSIFISEDLKLYINEYQKNDGNYLFDLEKNLGKNGEEIDYIELNKLRVYTDWRPNYGTINYELIDYYQNEKVMGNIVELPHLLQVMRGWI